MLKLNHTALHKIKLQAMRTYPEECCGVLLGKEERQTKVVYDILPMNNKKNENRTTRYLILPEDYKRAEEEASKEGVSLMGLYHSHPDHPSQPSEVDLEHALPWWSYIIVSVEDGQPTAVTSWVLSDDHLMFEKEFLEIVDGEFKHLCGDA